MLYSLAITYTVQPYSMNSSHPKVMTGHIALMGGDCIGTGIWMQTQVQLCTELEAESMDCN